MCAESAPFDAARLGMKRWFGLIAAIVASVAIGTSIALSGVLASSGRAGPVDVTAAGAAQAVVAGPSAEMTSWINARRAARGLRPLSSNPAMAFVARAWSDRMLASGMVEHNPGLGSQAPSGWVDLAENVGTGDTVDALESAFWTSSGHRANILGDYAALGIGVSRRADGALFVTVDFLR